MKPKVALIVCLCVAFLAIGLVFWPTLYRYDRVTSGGTSLPLRMNRVTGQTELFINGRWMKTRGPSEELPDEELKKITGRAGFKGGTLSEDLEFYFGHNRFGGTLHNGSSWHVEEVRVSITITWPNGTVNWSRVYTAQIALAPLTAQEFMIYNITDVPLLSSLYSSSRHATSNWRLVSAKGYLPK